MMIEGRCTLSRLPVQKCPEFMMASYSVPCNRAERVLYTERRKCSLVRDHPSTDDPSPECRLAARRVIVEGHFSQHLTRPRDADHHLIVLLLLCDFHPAALDDDGVAWGGRRRGTTVRTSKILREKARRFPSSLASPTRRSPSGPNFGYRRNGDENGDGGACRPRFRFSSSPARACRRGASSVPRPRRSAARRRTPRCCPGWRSGPDRSRP